MVIHNNLKGQLKSEIGQLVKAIVELSAQSDAKFHNQEILELSQEIDALINQYYSTP